MEKFKNLPIVKKLGFNRIVLVVIMVLLYFLFSVVSGRPLDMGNVLNTVDFMGFLALGVTFVIAQRVSAIADSDLILVMEDGAIVGQGTHQELIRNNEVYRGIVASQWGEEAIA